MRITRSRAAAGQVAEAYPKRMASRDRDPEADGFGPTSWMRAPGRIAAHALARAYFEFSYELLVESGAGRQFLTMTAAMDEPVHGYFTTADRDALLESLGARPGDRLLDLGCGVGGIALEVHRLTGAAVVGIDLSPHAVASAARRAESAGMGDTVTFAQGDLARPPRVDAAGAYAVDSLMFVPDLADALRGVGDALRPGGRLFATMLVVGRDPRDRLVDAFRAAGVHVEGLQDVTPALSVRSRARAGAARKLARDGATTARGHLAMRLVGVEEAVVGALVARGQVSRWRFVVAYR
jgi:SAM-dependent methyltransferase